MIVYSHSITPRLQYIIDFLTEYYGISIKLTSSQEKYEAAEDRCKLNYSFHRVAANELWLHPHPLLSESAVRPVKAVCFDYAGSKAFFKTEGDLPFDVFAAIFFLITRYEEYLPHQKDMYGRYAHENALAFKENFLKTPVVNIWLEELRKILSEKDPQFSKVKAQFSFIPTYDIDIAWSYKNKGFKRNAGALVQSFFKGRFKTFYNRVKVLRGRATDPYDCYQWLEELHHQYHLKPIYFFLMADKTGRFDKNISIQNQQFQNLIHQVAHQYAVGIHPSWQSGDASPLLKKEKSNLETLSQHVITQSRQHYIRFTLPQTYRKLLDAGIKDDYSMGYGSINGFRASIALPFYWYDLGKEEKTPLRIHPFPFMDANAFYEEQITAAAALDELKFYYETIRAVNGTFYTIWHNNILGSDAQFDGWQQAYEAFIKMVVT